MAGNWKSTTTAMENMEHSSKSCNDRMNMLDREDVQSLAKKQKLIDNTNADSSTSKGKGGGVVQNNYTFINIISSTGITIGDALCNARVLKEDQ